MGLVNRQLVQCNPNFLNFILTIWKRKATFTLPMGDAFEREDLGLSEKQIPRECCKRLYSL